MGIYVFLSGLLLNFSKIDQKTKFWEFFFSSIGKCNKNISDASVIFYLFLSDF